MKVVKILNVQSDTLLLADIFNTFQSMCLETYELDPAQVCYAAGLAWQAALKNKRKLDLLTDIDMLLMVEKVIRSATSHAIH